MKIKFKLFFLLLIAVPLLFLSCSKNETTDRQDATIIVNESDLKTDLVYCGTPLTASLIEYGQSTSYGTVTIGNNATTLQIKYQLTDPGYFINRPELFVGTVEQFDAIPGSTINPDGTIELVASPPNLPRDPGYVTLGSYWEYNIDLSTLPECFIVVAYARIRDVAGSGAFKDVFAKTMLKTSGYYLDYCVQQCPPPPPLGGCETGYAFGLNYATCFLTIPGVQSNNWGWSNGPVGAGNYSWPIYAGAGQCNIDNGTYVGTVTVNYVPPTATVTYSTINGYVLNATHLYVGNQILPKKNGKYTTAPGQFPYKHQNLGGVTTDTYIINGLSGNIYIAAHSEVCDDI
jgi:hypothetical protein